MTCCTDVVGRLPQTPPNFHRPVISTAYPAGLVYQDTIAICATEESFVYSLEQANQTTSSQPALQAVVREDTWEARAQQINQLLEQL